MAGKTVAAVVKLIDDLATRQNRLRHGPETSKNGSIMLLMSLTMPRSVYICRRDIDKISNCTSSSSWNSSS